MKSFSCRLALALSLAGILALVVYWRATGNQTTLISLKPDNTFLVEAGHAIYAAKCASCHGGRLQGQTSNWRERDAQGYLPAPPHDATGHTWHHSDQLLFEITKYGSSKSAGLEMKSRMPAYQGLLTDREIIAVLSFIKSRWPEDVRNRHDQLNTRQIRQSD